MDRVCIEKATGKLIEMQSGGKVERLPQTDKVSGKEYAKYLAECDATEAMRLNTLKQNALNAGYKEDEIEVKWITSEEWAAIEATLSQPTPEQIAEKEKEALIQAKMREMAIVELTKEGKIGDII